MTSYEVPQAFVYWAEIAGPVKWGFTGQINLWFISILELFCGSPLAPILHRRRGNKLKPVSPKLKTIWLKRRLLRSAKQELIPTPSLPTLEASWEVDWKQGPNFL